MSEWKGPWKCEKCGKHWEWRPGQLSPSGHMGLSGAFYCTGEVVPHDRRAPDPLLGLLREARNMLEKSKRIHYYCEDCWYSCPKAMDGCCNEAAGDECNCGADTFNVGIDAFLARLDAALAEPSAGEKEETK